MRSKWLTLCESVYSYCGPHIKNKMCLLVLARSILKFLCQVLPVLGEHLLGEHLTARLEKYNPFDVLVL